MVLGAALAFQPKFLDSRYSDITLYIFVSTCYLVLLAMTADLEFPFSYVVDYPGLILYLLFVLGLLRLKAKNFLAIIVTLLPISAIVMYLSNLSSIRMRGQFHGNEFHFPLNLFDNYYYISSLIYLASSMIVGYAIAGQLERDARAAFLRERQLERSNHELRVSRGDVENKTLALIAAKDELRASAERASRDKSKFLADAAHDLSQPTHAMSLLVESARVALARGDYERVASLIENASRAAQIARSSFRAVLEISQLESGHVKPTFTIFCVQDLVTEVVAPLRVIAETAGVRLRLRFARNDRPMLRSDRVLLGRALANLVANGIKYSDAAKGERRTVLIGIVPLSNRVRIDVVDNGLGMPESQWDLAFKPFVQLHNPEHKHERGLGLGLSIVTAIVALLPEHRLDLRSALGRGTRFSLEAPRHRGRPVSLLTEFDDSRTNGDFSSLFVWCVEDDEISLVAVEALLEDLGILFEQASSFESLEQQLQFTERRPDLVIADSRLPRGYSAKDVIALFFRRWGPSLPVLILTGEAASKSAETLGEHVEVLRKPTAPKDIIEAIRRLCFNAPLDPEGTG
jgi:signal transduction histidine kinase/CheY-like chemotaxis protein